MKKKCTTCMEKGILERAYKPDIDPYCHGLKKEIEWNPDLEPHPNWCAHWRMSDSAKAEKELFKKTKKKTNTLDSYFAGKMNNK